jgi:hypothetical protein
MKFRFPFVLKGEYSIPKRALRKNRDGKTLVSLPDEDGAFFLETVFEESEVIEGELDELFYELTYFFSESLTSDIRIILPGATIEQTVELVTTTQSPARMETGNAVIPFNLQGVVLVTIQSNRITQGQYEQLTNLFGNIAIHANYTLNDFTFRELSDLPNWKKLYIQLSYEDPLKEATYANTLARQQVRTITGFEGLPENITQKIGSYLTGPLNNSRLRSRPLPKALTKEVLEMTPYERQHRGGRTRKQKKSVKKSRKTSRHRRRHT